MTFEFNQATKAVSCKPCDWKVGEFLQVQIVNYNPTGKLRYEIEYKSDENINTEGLALFNKTTTASGAKVDTITTTFKYLYIPIENKDFSILTIKEFESDKLIDEQAYTYRPIGGIKFDVSSGFFVSGLINDKFILVNDSLSQKTIIKENTGDLRVGIGVLAHLHTRGEGFLNCGIAGGFELDNEAKIGYLAGISGLIGADQKFIFSIGAVFGKREVLSSAYAEGDKVDNAISILPTVDIWAGSWFGSLTYNF